LRLVLEVERDKVLSELPVTLVVNLVENEVKQVETGNEGRREVDVAGDGPLEVVLAADGVGGGEDGSTGVEGSNDTGLRDGNGLLFHHFVEDGTGSVGHLVELVNAADTAVGEDESTRFEDELLRVGVTGNIGGKTDGGGTLSGGVDTTGSDLVYVLCVREGSAWCKNEERKKKAHLQDLTLTCTGITDEKDVDVTPVPRSSRSSTLRQALVRSAEELEKNTLLDIVHLEDTRGERPREVVVDVGTARSLDEALLELRLGGGGTIGGVGTAVAVHVLVVLVGLSIEDILLLSVVLHTDSDDTTTVIGGTGRTVDAHALLVGLLDVKDVDVGLEERLDDSLLRVEADGDGAEDTGDGDTVSGFDGVDKLVVKTKRHSVRGLTVGNGVCERGLRQFR
jgi:hypothetical protein